MPRRILFALGVNTLIFSDVLTQRSLLLERQASTKCKTLGLHKPSEKRSFPFHDSLYPLCWLVADARFVSDI